MWKITSCLALLIAVVALCVGWMMHHKQDERMSHAAKQAEAAMVQRYAPMISALAESLGKQTPRDADLDEAIDNLADAIREAVRRSHEQPLETQFVQPGHDLDLQSANMTGTLHPDDLRPSAAAVGGPFEPVAATDANEEPRQESVVHAHEDGELVVSAERHEQYDLFIMDPQGSIRRQLTRNTANDHSPCWSPDGRQIAFASDLEGSFDVFVIDRRGGEPTRITFSEGDEIAPAWSPDGRRITYATRNGELRSIRVLELDSLGDTLLLENGDSPDWSPDGKHLAFVRDRQLHLALANGEVVEPMLGPSDAAKFLFAMHPRWSPDGRTILFTGFAKPESRSGQSDPMSELILVDVADRTIRQLGSGPGLRFGLDWSPDGTRVLYLLHHEEATGLYAISVDDAAVIRLTNPTVAVSGAAWRPNHALPVR